ncbi:MAG TPA: hypothetical protein VGD96_22455 [Bradyrhizobium sp.]
MSDEVATPLRKGTLPREWLLLIGTGMVAVTLAITNVPRLFGYREYRRAPEPAAWFTWRPNLAWALITALALAVSLFGMWQRLEFLYFQFWTARGEADVMFAISP